VHPVAAAHASVVHDLPSSQFVVAPAMHAPAWHVDDALHTRPLHDEARHCVPSVTLLHDVVLREVWHDWHAFPGFGAPSP
jgi:hypothetical protein